MQLVPKREAELAPDLDSDDDPFAAFASESTLTADPSVVALRGASSRASNPTAVRLARRILIVTLSLALLAAAGLTGVAALRARQGTPAPSGRVTLISVPSGAETSVDGIPRGVTPLSLKLPRGTYKVTLRSGVVTRQLSIRSRPGVEVVQNVELLTAAAATTGALTVSSDPPGLRVSVDGVERGTTPARIDGLVPGPHSVSLLTGDGSVDRPVVIEAGATATLHLASSVLPTAAMSFGSVTISAPIPIQLFERETLIGSSRSARLFLPAGTHRVTAVNEALGFRREIALEVKPGASTRVVVPMPNGTLSVNARPWAEVFVDGQSLGETPIGNHALPIGLHDLILKHPTLGERRQTVSIGLGRTVRVGVDFTQ